jgi:hypothetical protein
LLRRPDVDRAQEVTTWDLRIASDESAEEVISDRLTG